ncbi:MAG TPA: S8 family peptidase [Tissierellia bacterium]|nr:S8 family peptidase [Tissierellia bacterium]
MNRKKRHYIRIVLYLLLSVLILSGCATINLSDNEESSAEPVDTGNRVYKLDEKHIKIDPSTGYGYVDNVIVLVVKPEVENREILSWFPNEKAVIVGEIPGIHQVQVQINPRSKEELETLAKQMMEKEEVRFAHVDLAVSSEYMSMNQTASRNKGNEWIATIASESVPEEFPPDGWWQEAIGLEKSKELHSIEDYIKVGVVDDGFDTEHADLHLRFINESHKKLNHPEEHGTHVAGIVQQIMPKAQITVIDSHISPEDDPLSHYGTQTQFLSDLIEMVEDDVKVINYSMGASNESEDKIKWSEEYCGVNSVYIWLLKEKSRDFIIVQSAGNVGIDVYKNGVFSTLKDDNCLLSPEVIQSLGIATEDAKKAKQSVFDSIILVGACERKDKNGQYQILPFTNYGTHISIMAPGEEIESMAPGGGMMRMTGTSQAAPMVTGAVGILWSMDKNLTSGEIKDLLINSATLKVQDSLYKEHEGEREFYPLLNIYEVISQRKNRE